MDDVNKKQCETVGLQQSLIFATIGLIASVLLVVLMFGIKGTAEFLTSLYKSIIVAVSALYISAGTLGLIAGAMICENNRQSIRNRIIGIMLAESTLFISVMAGSSVEFFGNSKDYGAFEDYIFKPVYWVMVFGVIPALILGVVYSRKVEKQIDKRILK